MYKYSNNLLPHPYIDMFVLSQNLHNHNTRASSNLHLHMPQHRTTASQLNIKFSGSKYGIAYNCLSDIQIHTTLLNEN